MKRTALMMGLGLAFILYGVVAYFQTQTAYAQVRDASIRGTVYLDRNVNGVCVGEGEPVQAGIPIEFVSNDGKWSTYLQSGSDGTYGLVAAGYGTWTVSAKPNAQQYVVTSQASKSVFVVAENKVALGVDFCVAPANAVPGTGGGTLPSIATFASLPAAGGPSNNSWFMLTIALGVVLMAAGAGLYWQQRPVLE